MPERWHVSIVNPPTESEQATMMRRAVPYLASLLREVTHDGGAIGTGSPDRGAGGVRDGGRHEDGEEAA